MKRFFLLAALLLSFIAPLQAQVVPLVTVAEGPIKSITRQADGSLMLAVMGIPVLVKSTTRIHSTTALLSINQLSSNLRLPGRTLRGFMGATAIVLGSQDADGVMTANDLSLTPAENVVVGMITQNSNGIVAVNQMPVKVCLDARMPGRPFMNAFAIPIDITSVTPGTTCTLEGYYDDASLFQTTNLYVDTNAPAISTAPQVSFITVRGRENLAKGDDIEVLGGVTFFHAGAATFQTINLYRIDNNVARLIGSANAARDNAFPNYGLFRIKVTTPVTSDPVLSKAPNYVRAVNISQGAQSAFTEEFVDLR